MTSLVYAMGQGGAIEGQGGGFTAFVPLILMFAIFYFLLIRPQQKKQKEHRAMLTNLKKNERVITSGGIYGKITSLDDATVTLEIADKIRIKVSRGNISALNQPAAKSEK